MQVRLTYCEPRITEREPDAPDNLTEREPKFAMIASPAADDCKPLQVRAAVTLDWSNGPVEGQINRLKMLKRTMYGRAGLDLLGRRFLLAA